MWYSRTTFPTIRDGGSGAPALCGGHDLVVLTVNARDYLALHDEWQQRGEAHPGMLLVYRENNPQRDLTFAQIARAVSRLEQSGIPVRNTYHNVNMWREPRRV
jgi:hypothetical protein